MMPMIELHIILTKPIEIQASSNSKHRQISKIQTLSSLGRSFMGLIVLLKSLRLYHRYIF